MTRHAIVFWGTMLLAVIGIVTRGFALLTGLIIPVVLLLVLFLLYKYPPRRSYGGAGNARHKVKPSPKTMAKVAGMRKSQPPASKRKNYPFQVIEGSKGKSDDQLPKYH